MGDAASNPDDACAHPGSEPRLAAARLDPIHGLEETGGMEEYSLLGLALFIFVLGVAAFRPFKSEETFDDTSGEPVLPPKVANRTDNSGPRRR